MQQSVSVRSSFLMSVWCVTAFNHRLDWQMLWFENSISWFVPFLKTNGSWRSRSEQLLMYCRWIEVKSAPPQTFTRSEGRLCPLFSSPLSGQGLRPAGDYLISVLLKARDALLHSETLQIHNSRFMSAAAQNTTLNTYVKVKLSSETRRF